MNIDHNAAQAIQAREDGRAGAAKISIVCENGMVAVDASDKGPGQANELRVDLFQEFVKSKREGSIVLGLVVARNITPAHRGDVRLMNICSE